MKLIDKDALVAEIERKLSEEIQFLKGNPITEGTLLIEKDAYKKILSFIDTLEVKEVDLEKEIEKYLLTNATFLIGGNSKLVVHHIAKHFFELGMSVSNKAQKGE